MISPRRKGFTLIELVVVMACLIILGAILIPTVMGIQGDSLRTAGVDTVRARMADARASAMGDAIPYRLSVSSDGTQLRVDADDPASVEEGIKIHRSTETLPNGITVKVASEDGVQAVTDAEGWTKIATFLHDGTCREDVVEVIIQEPNSSPRILQIRGLTGAIRELKTAGAITP
jgi:prepilin-type N-terminal cleavage/methylation domain-containing protein